MNYLEKKKKAMLNYVSSGGGRLPSEYQEVEYIQSHTFEYINTGVVPNQDMQINIGVQRTNESSSYGDGTTFYFGSDTAWNKGYKIDHQRTNNLRVSFGDNFDVTNLSINTPIQHDIEVAQGYIDVDGTTNTFTQNNLTVTNPLLIFATNRNGTIYTGYGRFILYYFQIRENGNLVRDLVPCYHKTSGEIGLYDLVGRQFYTNDGTGTFTKGNDV